MIAGVPAVCPGTVTVAPCWGLKSANEQRKAYVPDPTSRLIGVMVAGPLFSTSA